MATNDPIAAVVRSIQPNSNAAEEDITAAPFPVYNYDDTVTETTYYVCYMTNNYDGTSNIKVTTPWKFLTFVGGQTCDIEVAFYRVADDLDSIDSFTFAAAKATLASEASATGELDYPSIEFTNAEADGIQPNELFVLAVTRDATGGTASPGDAQFTFPIITLA